MYILKKISVYFSKKSILSFIRLCLPLTFTVQCKLKIECYFKGRKDKMNISTVIASITHADPKAVAILKKKISVNQDIRSYTLMTVYIRMSKF